VHRDLKPGNIMLDGQGQLRITDFGLAGMAGEVKDIRSGTPGYLAPEQQAGREVTARSDIYALGVVLHEVFTGKRPSGDLSHPDLASEVDRVIRRCLAEDPSKRPASALQIAAALPGGDPLAAALAAGDTPTPGMVAAAGDNEGIPVRTASFCLAWILVGLVAVLILNAKVNVLRQTPFPHSPEILAQKAREMLESFGYAAPPADQAYEFAYDTGYRSYAEKQEKLSASRDQLAKGQPPLIDFWYRQSPQPLIVSSPFGYVSPKDPPPIVSGMIGMGLDPKGHLLQLDAVPPQVEQEPFAPGAFDWKPLFAAAGLDMSRFTAAEPHWISLAGFDTRAAWTGFYANAPEIPMRIEAASWRGKPVFFRVIAPWSTPERIPRFAPAPAAALVVVPVVLALGAFLAWPNFRAKRADIRGADRAAAFVFALAFLSHLLHAHHVAALSEVGVLILGAIDAAVPAASVWALYLAFEPYVRRRWPQSMISWSRALMGGFRDSMVGGHLLVGVALGIGLGLLNTGLRLSLEQRGIFVTEAFYQESLLSQLDARGLAEGLLNRLVGAFLVGMLFTFILMLLRVLLRRQWLAAAIFVSIGAASAWGSVHHPLISLVSGISFFILFAATLLRFGGLLPIIVCLFVGNTLGCLPVADFSAWYANTSVFAVVFFLGLTAYAFNTAVARRPLFKAGFLEAG